MTEMTVSEQMSLLVQDVVGEHQSVVVKPGGEVAVMDLSPLAVMVTDNPWMPQPFIACLIDKFASSPSYYTEGKFFEEAIQLHGVGGIADLLFNDLSTGLRYISGGNTLPHDVATALATLNEAIQDNYGPGAYPCPGPYITGKGKPHGH